MGVNVLDLHISSLYELMQISVPRDFDTITTFHCEIRELISTLNHSPNKNLRSIKCYGSEIYICFRTYPLIFMGSLSMPHKVTLLPSKLGDYEG